ncbi:MAG: phospholipase phosphocholine-specific, partial [Myxococcaceae bacterium]|nr:phospholipase phosphocholine-specific [Myxococcaceae bacterium]
MTKSSRRKFLQNAAGAGLGAVALSAFPPSIRKALAIPAFRKTGTIEDVKHVVILMQENRAFDQYFGTFPGVRGFGDRFGIPLPGGRKVWEQLDAQGKVVLPYHFDATQGNAQRASGTPHTWIDTHQAWDGGRMYQWPRYKHPNTMGYFEEAEIPFSRALASAFTVCDAYHCSAHTGTHANRSFHWTGTNGPTGAGVAFVNNPPGGNNPGPSSTSLYDWKTYAERLEEAGVSWLVYQNIPNHYGCNPLMSFRSFREANEAAPRPVTTSKKYEDEPPYAPQDAVGNPLLKGIANTLPAADQAAFDSGAFLDAFRKDVLEGRLPEVSWIIPPDVYSEHPGPSSPVQGAWYTQQILDALTANPEVFGKTVFIVNFDENDGYFDHVPSSSPPSPRGDGTYAGKTTLHDDDLSPEYFTQPYPPGMPTSGQAPQDGDVVGPGPRVPLWVISPWSRGGWVNSQVFDHTSVLRFLEARFGVREPNISAYRRAVNGDLVSAFNFVSPNDEALPTLAGKKTKAEADALRAAQQALPQITPAPDRGLPVQADGVRPSRALPYELHVSAHADAVVGIVRLSFVNTGRAAAVFHVYDKLHLDRLPQRYMVEPGKLLDDAWAVQADDAGHYDLWVLGPNGFHRHFTGDLSASRQAAPEVRVGYERLTGTVHMQLRNEGASALHFKVQSNNLY